MLNRVIACLALFLPSVAFAQNSVTVPLLDGPPPSGNLTHDHVVLFQANPGDCPDLHKGRRVEWYHLAIGGNDHQNISRQTRRCVVVASNPLKSANANDGWERGSERNTQVSRGAEPKRTIQRRILDREPPKGELGAGEVVLVKYSDRIRCGPSQLVRVVGASGSKGRRERSCTSQ